MFVRSPVPMLSALALLALIAWWSMSGLPGISPAHAATKPNVILILVDAMRADHLSAYGYSRTTTPSLTRFASRGAVFENTISQAAWTVPSVASLFTGVDPQAHQMLTFKAKLSSAHTTIAETFKAGGYSTTGLLKSIVVEAERGYSQGFDSYTVINPKQNQADGDSGRELTDAAISFLETQKAATKPFFLYMHYMDTHSPYKAPEPYYSKYRSPSYTGPVSGAHKQIEETYEKGGQTPTAADIQQMIDLYDADVEYWDSQFGRLMANLVGSGLDPNTIVIVTADHGEAFFEHPKNVFHGHVYQENIRIPFVIKGPGVKVARLKHWAQSIDIAPTLAALTGLPLGKYWQGRNQAPVLLGTGAAPILPVYSEYADWRTVIDANSQKVMLGGPGAPMLYNLPTDGKEQTNLASGASAEVERLRGVADPRIQAARTLAGNFPADDTATMTRETCLQLLALGYTESCPE